MPVHVLSGADVLATAAAREELLAAHGADPADVAHHLLERADDARAVRAAMATVAMFAPRRAFDVRTQELSAEMATTLCVHLAGPEDLLVVTSTAALSAAAKKALGEHATLRHHPLPAPGRATAARITQMAAEAHVALEPGLAEHLADLVGADLTRVRSALRVCTLTGQTSPTRSQMLLLMGTASATVAPWQVTSALERGTLDIALEHARRCEPVPTVVALLTRLSQAARVHEAGLTSPTQIQQALGVSAQASTSLLALASRLDDESIAASYELLVRTDREVKASAQSRMVLSVALVELAALWSPAGRG